MILRLFLVLQKIVGTVLIDRALFVYRPTLHAVISQPLEM